MPKYLRNPEFLNIRLLPKEYRYKIVDSLDYIKNNFNNQQTQTRFEQILNYYDSGFMTDTTQLKMFIEEYNRRRNLNFKEVFPEYDWLFK
jgi:uncharacterized protein YutD